jgi:hypothetical protein
VLDLPDLGKRSIKLSITQVLRAKHEADLDVGES